MTVTQAAKILEVDRSTIYRWIRLDLLPAVKMVGTVRIPDEEVERAKICGIREPNCNLSPIPKTRSRVRSKGRRPWEK